MDLTDDLEADDLDALEQDEILLREIEELQLVNWCIFVVSSVKKNMWLLYSHSAQALGP